jgi:CNP1-like family
MFRFFRLSVAALLLPVMAWAQLAADNPDWKESEVPSAPKFDVARLVEFDVSAASSLRFGIDPSTVSITKEGLVRYVVVASNSTGALNAIYEGVRCATLEVKIYARFTASGGWKPTSNAEWQSLTNTNLPRHSAILARQALCQGGRAPEASVDRMMRLLKGTLIESKN